MLIEPYFVFMDPDIVFFTVLERQNWPQREDVETSLDVRMLTTDAKIFTKALPLIYGGMNNSADQTAVSAK